MFLSAIYASVQNVCFEDGPAHTITTNSLSVRPQPPPQPAAFSTFIALFVLGCRERERGREETDWAPSFLDAKFRKCSQNEQPTVLPRVGSERLQTGAVLSILGAG